MKFNIFELEFFSFNSYIYYLTRGFIASTDAFNLLTCAFNLPTRVFSLLTRGFELVACGLELVTRSFKLVTRRFEFVTRRFEFVTCGFEFVSCRFELVTRNLCYTFPRNRSLQGKKGHNNLCILTLCNINSFNITNQKFVFHKITSIKSS